MALPADTKAPDPPLGQLEEGLDRPDHEHRVPEEADQLARRSAARRRPRGRRARSTRPGTGRRTARCTRRRRLPDSRRPRRPGGCAGTGRRSCGRRSARRRSRAGSAARPRCRWPCRSAPPTGCAPAPRGAAAAPAAAGPASRSSARRPAPSPRARTRWTAPCRRSPGTRPARRRPGRRSRSARRTRRCPRPATLSTSPVGVRCGSTWPSWRVLRLTIFIGPYMPISQARTTQVWLSTPASHPDHHQAEQHQASSPTRPRSPTSDALVDDPADQVRAERAGQPLQHRGDGRDEQHRPLLGQQPAQEPGRAAGVGIGEDAVRRLRAYAGPTHRTGRPAEVRGDSNPRRAAGSRA